MQTIIRWLEQRSRMSFILMFIVGAYLFYAIYQMRAGLDSLSGSPVPIYVFMGLFALVGLLLLGVGLYALLSGHYREKVDAAPTEGKNDNSDFE